jgi:hypothetical protein
MMMMQVFKTPFCRRNSREYEKEFRQQLSTIWARVLKKLGQPWLRPTGVMKL